MKPRFAGNVPAGYRPALLVGAALLAATLPQFALAQTTWTGTTDSHWETDTNWNNNAPTSATGAVLTGNGGANQPTLFAAQSALSLTMNGSGNASGNSSSPAPFTTPRGATFLPVTGGSSPSPSFSTCATCVDQEKQRQRSRAVLTTTGKNTKGIVARLTARIADAGGDILDISQTLIGDYFTMIIVIDVGALSCSFERFGEEIQAAAKELGCRR